MEIKTRYFCFFGKGYDFDWPDADDWLVTDDKEEDPCSDCKNKENCTEDHQHEGNGHHKDQCGREPKNNDGRYPESCYWCGGELEIRQGFSKTYHICKKCGR